MAFLCQDTFSAEKRARVDPSQNPSLTPKTELNSLIGKIAKKAPAHDFALGLLRKLAWLLLTLRSCRKVRQCTWPTRSWAAISEFYLMEFSKNDSLCGTWRKYQMYFWRLLHIVLYGNEQNKELAQYSLWQCKTEDRTLLSGWIAANLLSELVHLVMDTMDLVGKKYNIGTFSFSAV